MVRIKCPNFRVHPVYFLVFWLPDFQETDKMASVCFTTPSLRCYYGIAEYFNRSVCGVYRFEPNESGVVDYSCFGEYFELQILENGHENLLTWRVFFGPLFSKAKHF